MYNNNTNGDAYCVKIKFSFPFLLAYFLPLLASNTKKGEKKIN